VPEVGGEIVEAQAVAGDEHDLDATLGELAGELLADSTAGAGDQGGHAGLDYCGVAPGLIGWSAAAVFRQRSWRSRRPHGDSLCQRWVPGRVVS
jgi:hypothetical protein